LAVSAGFLSNVLLARLLEPEHYGAFLVAGTVVVFGVTIGVLGLDQTAVRLLSEALAARRYGRVVLTIRTLLAFGFWGSAGAIACFWLLKTYLFQNAFGVPILEICSLGIAVWLGAGAVQRIFAEIFRGLGDIRAATILGGIKGTGILTGLFTLVGILILAASGHARLESVVWLSALVSVGVAFVGGVWLWLRTNELVRRQEGEFTDATGGSSDGVTAAVLRVGTSLFLLSILVAIRTNIDIWLVGMWLTSTDVAVYGAPAKLVNLVFVPLLITNAALAPLIAEAFGQGGAARVEKVVRVAATLASIPAVTLTIIIGLFSANILGVVFGEFYRAGSAVLVILLIGQAANVLAGPYLLVLVMRGKERASVAGVLVGLLFVLLAAHPLISLWGVQGMAIATTAGRLVQIVVMLLVVRHTLSIKTEIYWSPVKAWRGLQDLWDQRSR